MPTTFPRMLVVILGVTALAVSATAQQSPTATKTSSTVPTLAPPAAQASPPYSPFGSQGGGFGGMQGSGTGLFSSRGGLYPASSADPATQKLYAEEMGLAQEGDRLARQLFDAKSDADKEKLKARLSETLEKQFDARQKRHEGEIAALEAQVKKLRELVSKRQENRRDIVTRRLEQLQRDAQGLGW